MKKGIHPDYHEITYVMTDGTEKKVHSTWGKAGDKMTLEIDPKSHPAWTGVHRMVDSGGQVGKFNNKFAKFGLKASKQFRLEQISAKTCMKIQVFVQLD